MYTDDPGYRQMCLFKTCPRALGELTVGWDLENCTMYYSSFEIDWLPQYSNGFEALMSEENYIIRWALNRSAGFCGCGSRYLIRTGMSPLHSTILIQFVLHAINSNSLREHILALFGLKSYLRKRTSKLCDATPTQMSGRYEVILFVD